LEPQEPGWINGIGSADQKTAITAFIKAVGQRFLRIDFVDICNETLHAPSSYHNTVGGSGSTNGIELFGSLNKQELHYPILNY
jgi:GH35 family endo-1,4-beta-xylanase